MSKFMLSTGAGLAASDFIPRMAPGDYTRAHSDAVCTSCGKPYWRHPYDPYEVDGWTGTPWLQVLCDGSRVKL